MEGQPSFSSDRFDASPVAAAGFEPASPKGARDFKSLVYTVPPRGLKFS